jgi:hypothetical protein
MKLKDADIKDLLDLFEEALNRAQRLDKQQRIHFRKKIRNELFTLLSWELATASAILSRWEDRLSDVFSALPFGFKEEIANALTEKLRSPLLGKHGKDSLDKLYRKSTRTATD